MLLTMLLSFVWSKKQWSHWPWPGESFLFWSRFCQASCNDGELADPQPFGFDWKSHLNASSCLTDETSFHSQNWMGNYLGCWVFCFVFCFVLQIWHKLESSGKKGTSIEKFKINWCDNWLTSGHLADVPQCWGFKTSIWLQSPLFFDLRHPIKYLIVN